MHQDALAALDPGDILLIRQLADGEPPVVALSPAALIADLRAIAADRPAVPEPDDIPAVTEPDGQVTTRHPLQPGNDGN